MTHSGWRVCVVTLPMLADIEFRFRINETIKATSKTYGTFTILNSVGLIIRKKI